MEIARFIIGPLMTNCYVVSDEREAVIIDAAGCEPDLISYINDNHLKAKAVLLTHGHFDHTGGAAQFSDILKAPIAIGKNDEEMYYDNDINGVSTFGTYPFRTKKIELILSEGHKIKFGGSCFDVIETPGHSAGGVSFYTEGHLFCGDALFKESIGRTDLYGGDYDTLIRSITDKLFPLDESTIVYPGHGPSTTIGYEKKHNFYVSG